MQNNQRWFLAWLRTNLIGITGGFILAFLLARLIRWDLAFPAASSTVEERLTQLALNLQSGLLLIAALPLSFILGLLQTSFSGLPRKAATGWLTAIAWGWLAGVVAYFVLMILIVVATDSPTGPDAIAPLGLAVALLALGIGHVAKGRKMPQQVPGTWLWVVAHPIGLAVGVFVSVGLLGGLVDAPIRRLLAPLYRSVMSRGGDFNTLITIQGVVDVALAGVIASIVYSAITAYPLATLGTGRGKRQ